MKRPNPQIPQSNGFAVARDLNPRLVSIELLKPLGRETRKDPPKQVRKLVNCLEQFGFVLPIVVEGNNYVVAGWGVVLAARRMGLAEVPAIVIWDLDEAKLRLLRLALNRLGEDSRWDYYALKQEFSEILEISSDIDLQMSGFEMGEIDVALSIGADDEEDVLPALNDAEPPVTKPGDLWVLGDHRVLCGDALDPKNYVRLMGGELARIVFTDPPWNIPIAGNVSGLGAVKHEDFAMACGDMTAAEYEAFLGKSHSFAAAYCVDGAVLFVCMHWSKMGEMLAAAAGIALVLLALCVWNKTNAGMGSLYRSKHELVFVFKKGSAPHVNNVELGRYGRNRTNVWDYPGQNMFNGSGKSKLSLHPTAKPVALVADAIRDCSNRGDVILDPFGGVGSTLIAAERTGRRARLIEIDPKYVDAIIRRWETLTGKCAVKLAPESSTPEPDHRSQGGVRLLADPRAPASEGAAS